MTIKAEQGQVAAVLQGSTVPLLEKEILEKERTLELKDLLISEALDALSCQQPPPITFGKDFEPVASASSESDAVGSRTFAKSPTVEKSDELSVLNTWEVIVRDCLCIGLELQNASETRIVSDIRSSILDDVAFRSVDSGYCSKSLLLKRQHGSSYPKRISSLPPKSEGVCVLRTPLPGPGKLHVLICWASTESEEKRICRFQTCLDSARWKLQQFVLHSIDFNPLVHRMKSIKSVEDLRRDCGWPSVFAVFCCQTEKSFISGLDYTEFRKKIATLTKPVIFEELFKGCFIPRDSQGFSEIALYFEEEENRFSVLAWTESECAAFLDVFSRLQDWKLILLDKQPIGRFEIKESQQIMRKSLHELKKFLEKLKKNTGSADSTKVSGELCRNLGDKILLQCLCE